MVSQLSQLDILNDDYDLIFILQGQAQAGNRRGQRMSADYGAFIPRLIKRIRVSSLTVPILHHAIYSSNSRGSVSR